MKNLIELTDKSATYEFSHNTATRTVTYHKPEDVDITPDFAAVAETDHSAWLTWLGAFE
jgi:hypothetical protein